jgi:hypothetical protein
MNALQLRQWLQNPIGKRFHVGNFNAPFRMGGVPGPGTAANSSTMQYFPCIVNRKQGGFGFHLDITGCFPAGQHGIFVKDHQNQCLHAVATNKCIIISGRFNGCTWAQCTDLAGNIYVAHIFRDAHVAGNNPVTQARNFEIACHAMPNTAVGFQTLGLVVPPADRLYVFGTYHLGNWQWDYITADPNEVVVTGRQLVPADWVVL